MFRAQRLDHIGFTARDVRSLAACYEVWDQGIADPLYLEDPEGHRIELTTYRD